METNKIDGIAFWAGKYPLDEDRPTLVMIHGAGGAKVLWEHQVAALAGTVNTLALDLPGHGESDGPAAESVAAYAGAVARFLDALRVRDPIPCGLSMGGAITQTLLLEFPDRFRAGILVSTGARLRVNPLIFDSIAQNYADHIKLLPAVAASPGTRPETLARYLEASAACPPEVALGDFRACDAFDVMEALAKIRVPVLVVTAHDDQLTPPKYGAFLVERIPGAEACQIPDAGHLVPLEQPAAFNQAVEAFLEKIGT